MKSKKYNELVILYQAKGLHKKGWLCCGTLVITVSDVLKE